LCRWLDSGVLAFDSLAAILLHQAAPRVLSGETWLRTAAPVNSLSKIDARENENYTYRIDSTIYPIKFMAYNVYHMVQFRPASPPLKAGLNVAET
jgi:hypothetical protein